MMVLPPEFLDEAGIILADDRFPPALDLADNLTMLIRNLHIGKRFPAAVLIAVEVACQDLIQDAPGSISLREIPSVRDLCPEIQIYPHRCHRSHFDVEGYFIPQTALESVNSRFSSVMTQYILFFRDRKVPYAFGTVC